MDGLQDYLPNTPDPVNIVMQHPIPDVDGHCDNDSNGSDDDSSANNLLKRILLTNLLSGQPLSPDAPPTELAEGHPPNCKKPRIDEEWKSNGEERSIDTTDIVPQNAVEGPIKYIEYYWSSEWIDSLCFHSQKYAQSKSLSCSNITPSNMRMFLSVLLLSGYNTLPNRRLYWTEAPDVFNQLVSRSMRRDTFEQLLRCLSFTEECDSLPLDSFHAVRPLFEHLNNVSKDMIGREAVSVDEIIVPCFGKYRDKQLGEGKNFRISFKLLAACTEDGSLLHVQPLGEADANAAEKGKWNTVPEKLRQLGMPETLQYGKNGAGVGLFDQNLSAYRVQIRAKKWWWPLFAWSLNAQAVNAWMFLKKNGSAMSLLEFIRHIVNSTLMSYGAIRRTSEKPFPTRASSGAVRYNGLQHWTVKGDQRNARCKGCGRRTIYVCEMCRVALHPECMKTYHAQWPLNGPTILSDLLISLTMEGMAHNSFYGP